MIAQVCEKEGRDEITDIAAQALSLQPKGYTLETTEVSLASTPPHPHFSQLYAVHLAHLLFTNIFSG